jgi:hypothetical protein
LYAWSPVLACGDDGPRRPASSAAVRVTAAGGFDTATWQSTGIEYSAEISSDAPADQLAQLLNVVDEVAEQCAREWSAVAARPLAELRAAAAMR